VKYSRGSPWYLIIEMERYQKRIQIIKTILTTIKCIEVRHGGSQWVQDYPFEDAD
jgi:hypothetical protein